jgi:hypothetical protein
MPEEGRQSPMREYSADTFLRYLSAHSVQTPEQQIVPKPAITISRQTGAGALTVANPKIAL